MKIAYIGGHRYSFTALLSSNGNRIRMTGEIKRQRLQSEQELS